MSNQIKCSDILEPHCQLLPSHGLLKKNWQFKQVYKHGTRIKGQCFSLIFLVNNCNGSRVGISIHGEKKAVNRNRTKRILKEFFRLNRVSLTTLLVDASEQSVDLVFTVRKGFKPSSPCEIASMVYKLIDSWKIKTKGAL
jgi:ribonuclease P protein component